MHGVIVPGEGEDRPILPGQPGGPRPILGGVAAPGQYAHGGMAPGADQIRPGGLEPARVLVEGHDHGPVAVVIEPGPVDLVPGIDKFRLRLGLSRGIGRGGGLVTPRAEEGRPLKGPLVVASGASRHHAAVLKQGRRVPQAPVEGDHVLPVGHVALAAAVVPRGQKLSLGGEAQGEVGPAAHVHHVLPCGHVALAEAVVPAGQHPPVGGQGHGMAKPRGEGDHPRPFAHLALAIQVQTRGHHRAVLREPQAVKPAGGHLCDAGPLRRPGPAVGVVSKVGHGAVAVEDQTVVPAQGPVPGVHDRLGGVGGAQGVPHQLHPSTGQLHPAEGPADHRVRPRQLARQTLVAPVPRQQGSLPQGQGVPGAGPQFVPIYIMHLLGHLPPAVFQLLPEGGPGVRVLHLFRKGQGVRKAQPLQRGPGLRRQGLVPGRFPLRFDLGDQLRLKTGLLQQGQRFLQPPL